jgi:hypothetical protein
VEAHVVGVKANDSKGMDSTIVQEMGDGFGGDFSSLCLGGCERARGSEES